MGEKNGSEYESMMGKHWQSRGRSNEALALETPKLKRRSVQLAPFHQAVARNSPFRVEGEFIRGSVNCLRWHFLCVKLICQYDHPRPPSFGEDLMQTSHAMTLGSWGSVLSSGRTR